MRSFVQFEIDLDIDVSRPDVMERCAAAKKVRDETAEQNKFGNFAVRLNEANRERSASARAPRLRTGSDTVGLSEVVGGFGRTSPGGDEICIDASGERHVDILDRWPT